MVTLFRKRIDNIRVKLKEHACNFKRYAIAVTLFFTFGSTQTIIAQENPWFFGLYSHSNSFISNNVLGLIDVLVNSAIANAIDGDASGDFIIYNYHYVDLKDNGEKIVFKQNNPYSFKLYDLLNDVEAGIKVGWQGAQSPIGLYLYGAYVSINTIFVSWENGITVDISYRV